MHHLKSLHHKTSFVINPRQSALASMNQSSWLETLTIMSGWIQPSARSTKEGDDNVLGLDSSVKLSGYTLDAVERLLQRLIVETATANPIITVERRERDVDIARWQKVLLHSWIQLSRQQTETEMIGICAERAEFSLGRFVQWYNQGGYWVASAEGAGQEDPLPVPAFALLVQEWLRMRTVDGCLRAADLLMTWTEGDEALSLVEGYKDQITPCFNSALEQCANLLETDHLRENEDLGKTAASLAERMDLLRESGWEGVDEISVLLRKIAMMESIHSDSITQDNSMFEQMTDLIAQAESSDYDTIVHGVIPRYKASKDLDLEVSADISATLTDYFVRLKDARLATKWLKTWDNIITDMQKKEGAWVPLKRFIAVFELWLENEEESEEAVFRADEVIARCEQIERQFYRSSAPFLLDVNLHLKLLRMWGRSKVSARVSAMKARQIFNRLSSHHELFPVESITIDDVKWFLTATTRDKSTQLDKNELGFILSIVKKQWPSAPHAPPLEEVIGMLVSELECLGMDILTAFGFPDEVKGEGISVEEKLRLKKRALRYFLPSLPRELRLDFIKSMGGFDDADTSGWDVHCFSLTVPRLVMCEHTDVASISAAKGLLEVALKRIVDKNLPKTPREYIATMLEKTIRNCTFEHLYQHLPSDNSRVARRGKVIVALDFLRLAEISLLSMDPEDTVRQRYPASPIPVSCFQHVLLRQVSAEEYNLVEETYVRLFDYYRSGYSDLWPPQSSIEVGQLNKS